MHQVLLRIVQALLSLWRLARLVDLVKRVFEYCQSHWPHDWFDHLGAWRAHAAAWFDQLLGPPPC